MIKAVLYDLGDIFFEAHYWRQWMWEFFTEKEYFNGTFAEFYSLYEQWLLPVYEGKIDYQKQYLNFLKYLGIQDPETFKRKSFLQKKSYEDKRELFPEVASTLQKLRDNGIVNVVVSDNEAGEQWVRDHLLKKFEIDEYINKVYTSKDLSATKPAPEVFEKILEALKFEIDEILFMAHDADEINGAQEQKIKTIEFNNYLQVPTNAEFQINNFSGIIDIIIKLNHN